MPCLPHLQTWISQICSQELPFLFVLPDYNFFNLSGKFVPNFELFHYNNSKSPILPGNFHFNFFLEAIFFFSTSFNPAFIWVCESSEIQKAKLQEPHLASSFGILFCIS